MKTPARSRTCNHKFKVVKSFTNEDRSLYTLKLVGFYDVWVLQCSKCGDMKNHWVWRSKNE